MNLLRKFASYVKVEHSLFSLPLLFSGAFLAQNEWPSWRLTLLIFIAAINARIVAMSLNRIFDRHIDALNPRTQMRHLPSGALTLFQAWIICLGALLGYLYCAWKISELCLKLSWIPLVGFVVYPFFKRFTKWTHLGLGLVWSLVPLAGFISVGPSIKMAYPVIIICLFSILWLAGFDIIYAADDEDFDRQHGLYSLPAAWGLEKALRFSAHLHVISFVLLVVLYFTWMSGIGPVLILFLIGLLFLFEHFFSSSLRFAFLHVNVAIGFLVLFFVILGVKAP